MEKSEVISKQMIIIGGSAGSLVVLMKTLPRLDSIRVPIVIVLHRKGGEDTMLEDIIALKTKIPVKLVDDKMEVLSGCIYVAPAGYHMLFENDFTISLDTSPPINYSRPSIDVSFESASEVYGANLIGILLSGANNDGTQGLMAIQSKLGKTVVQSPESAEIAFMPEHAIDKMAPDHILDVAGLLDFITLYK